MIQSTICSKDEMHYLLDRLRRLDSLLERAVEEARARGGEGDPFRGLYISDKDAARLIENHPSIPQSRDTFSSGSEIARRYPEERSTSRMKEDSLPAGKEPRLRRLARIFNLCNEEIKALVICLAIELDPKYEKLYAYLQDDLSKKSPTIGFIIDLLSSSSEEKIAIRNLFLPNAPLFKHGILELADGRASGAQMQMQLSSPLRLNQDVLAWILGSSNGDDANNNTDSDAYISADTGADADNMDPSDLNGSRGACSLPIPLPASSTSRLPSSLLPRLENLAFQLRERRGAICSLQGSYGSGRREAAEVICRRLEMGIVTLDPAGLPSDEKDLEAAVSGAFRQALLDEAAMYLQDFDYGAIDDSKAAQVAQLKVALIRALEEFQGLIFIESRDTLDLGRRLQRRTVILKIPKPDLKERLDAWRGQMPGWPEEEIAELANKFRLTAGQIEDAISSARGLAAIEGRSSLCKEDLYEGCRMQSSRKLSDLARRILPRYRLRDVVLPQDCTEQLRDIEAYVRNQGRVYEEWGFGRLSLGKGLNILFSGDSGTGKTMAAEALACELGLELYKIDLSTVVSKYIGETEKNLSRIFAEAEESNAILFFDEADAIFGKRSEVKDAHDRYANVEIGYLLQKMEEHEGIVVLATNLDQNLDEAFKRRMHFVVRFPFPGEESRLEIWRSLMPAEAAVAEDVDFDFLARAFQISGGNIKNVLVAAAFLAAEESESDVITMDHMVRATAREMKKLGRICGESELRQYYGMVKGK